MSQRVAISTMVLICALSAAVTPVAGQQASPSGGVTVRMIVTVEARHGSTVPVINREDVMVYQGHDRDRVTDWVPLQGDRAGLELFILVDDALSTSVGSQLSDIQKFIAAQPATTAIGVGYMQHGTVEVAQNLTTDHPQAAKALRLPLGSRGISSSPYLSVTDLIKKWPEQQERREIVMITDGVDALNGGGPANPYLDEAIAQAQRAEVIVYSIYAPGAGHYGHSYWRMHWGQNYLGQLADETGGEAYNLFMGNPVSLTAYFDDIEQKLGHQYLLTFIPKLEQKAGEQSVKITTEVPNAELVAADRFYVPGM